MVTDAPQHLSVLALLKQTVALHLKSKFCLNKTPLDQNDSQKYLVNQIRTDQAVDISYNYSY